MAFNYPSTVGGCDSGCLLCYPFQKPFSISLTTTGPKPAAKPTTDIRVGDTIELTEKPIKPGVISGRVTAQRPGGVQLDGWWYTLKNYETPKLVKRDRPKAGALLTPGEIRAFPWKRGTVIEYDSVSGYPIVRVLNAKGSWLNMNNGSALTFDDLTYSYTLRYDPSAK